MDSFCRAMLVSLIWIHSLLWVLKSGHVQLYKPPCMLESAES